MALETGIPMLTQLIIGVVTTLVAMILSSIFSFALGKAISEAKIAKIDERLHDIEKSIVELKTHYDAIESSRENIRAIYVTLDSLRNRIAIIEGYTAATNDS